MHESIIYECIIIRWHILLSIFTFTIVWSLKCQRRHRHNNVNESCYFQNKKKHQQRICSSEFRKFFCIQLKCHYGKHWNVKTNKNSHLVWWAQFYYSSTAKRAYFAFQNFISQNRKTLVTREWVRNPDTYKENKDPIQIEIIAINRHRQLHLSQQEDSPKRCRPAHTKSVHHGKSIFIIEEPFRQSVRN